jgi:putative PIN family toxin of toxin-antitoxin system
MPPVNSELVCWDGIEYDTAMPPRIVLDTNVLIAALCSQQSASYKILSLIGMGKFDLTISVPLVLEYEDVAKRQSRPLRLSHKVIDDILDYVCQVGEWRHIFFLWRPFLKDPKDDMVLELAVEAGCDYIVTFNRKDFVGAEQFGLQVIAPRDFLQLIGELL